MKQPRSKDYDLRAAVVRELLAFGVPRQAIRHEITLDSSSSDGRADMVLALDAGLWGIEIKSGSDTLDRLDSQRRRYRTRFDRLCLVLDKRLKPTAAAATAQCWPVEYEQHLQFGCVPIAATLDGGISFEPYDGKHIEWVDWPWRPSGRGRAPGQVGASTCLAPFDMLSLLWAQEIVAVAARLVIDGIIPAAAGTARCRLIPHLAEHAPIAKLRPLIAQALRQRELNRWEQAFWARYDAETPQVAA